MNADPPAYRYEINDLKDRCREKLLDFFIALRREIEDEDFLTLKEGAGTGWKRQIREQPTGRAYLKEHQSPPDLSARSRPMDRKMQERKMKDEKKYMLWECEIRGRGVRSRTTAGASSSDS